MNNTLPSPIFRSRTLWVSFGFSTIIFVTYKTWKFFEIKRLHLKCIHLVKYGFVIVKEVSPKQKRKSWEALLRVLEHTWSEKIKNFRISEVFTWPKPADGRAYNLNITTQVQGLPCLYSHNYDLQSTLCGLFDYNISKLHFGDKTHWKLKLLIDPLWLILGGLYKPHNSLNLQGDDQSWHFTQWPNPSKNTGEPIPFGVHIDNGHLNKYEKGLPSLTSSEVESIDERMFRMLTFQIGILLYSDTPGCLGPAEGMTGILPLSHFAVLEALRSCACNNQVVENRFFRETMKQWGAGKIPLQVTMQEDEAVLVLGTLAHTAMYPTRPMEGGLPRVIQNAKVYLKNAEVPEVQQAFVTALQSMCATATETPSLITELYRRPLNLCRELWKENPRFCEEVEADYKQLLTMLDNKIHL